MYYVYVLVEKLTKKTYVGYSSDLKQRIKDHQAGKGCKTTKKGDWQLVYYETFSSKEDAIKRESKLKYYGNTKTSLFKHIQGSLAG